MTNTQTETVVVIGGGPAGLTAAIYLGRAGLSPLVFAGSPVGGQLGQLSSAPKVENYPGLEPIWGGELLQKMKDQTEKFGARIIDKNVIKVDFSKRPFHIFLPERLAAKTILIATGAKPVWLGLESEKRLQGKGVSTCVTCDGFFFRDKVVAVVGGGNMALQEALALTKLAKKVYLIHRRDQFRASKIIQERVKNNPKIEIVYNTVVEEIVGENKVTAVKLKTKNSKLKTTTQILKLDGVFIAIGHKPDTEIFRDKITLDDKGYIVTANRIAQENLKFEILNLKSNSNDSSFKNLNIENSLKIKNFKLKIQKFDYRYASQTSVPGVFAAGDCVNYQYRQVAAAVGTGAIAALDVERFLEA